MEKKRRDNIISFIPLKHSMLMRVVVCLLSALFTITNVTYGYDNESTLRQIRYAETATGQGMGRPIALGAGLAASIDEVAENVRQEYFTILDGIERESSLDDIFHIFQRKDVAAGTVRRLDIGDAQLLRQLEQGLIDSLAFEVSLRRIRGQNSWIIQKGSEHGGPSDVEVNNVAVSRYCFNADIHSHRTVMRAIPSGKDLWDSYIDYDRSNEDRDCFIRAKEGITIVNVGGLADSLSYDEIKMLLFSTIPKRLEGRIREEHGVKQVTLRTTDPIARPYIEEELAQLEREGKIRVEFVPWKAVSEDMLAAKEVKLSDQLQSPSVAKRIRAHSLLNRFRKAIDRDSLISLYNIVSQDPSEEVQAEVLYNKIGCTFFENNKKDRIVACFSNSSLPLIRALASVQLYTAQSVNQAVDAKSERFYDKDRSLKALPGNIRYKVRAMFKLHLNRSLYSAIGLKPEERAVIGAERLEIYLTRLYEAGMSRGGIDDPLTEANRVLRRRWQMTALDNVGGPAANRMPAGGQARPGTAVPVPDHADQRDDNDLQNIAIEHYALPGADIKIAVVQLNRPPNLWEIEEPECRKAVTGYMEEAVGLCRVLASKEEPLDLVLFPEGIAAYEGMAGVGSGEYVDGIDQACKSHIPEISRLAKENNMAIGLGVLLKSVSGNLSSVYLIFTPEGKIIENNKDNSLNEERIFAIKGIDIGVMICREAVNNILITRLSEKQVDLVAMPSHQEHKAAQESVNRLPVKGLKNIVLVNNAESGDPRFGGSIWRSQVGESVFREELPTEVRQIAIFGFNKDVGIPANKTKDALKSPLEDKKDMVGDILSGRHPRVLAEKFVIPENARERLTPHAYPSSISSSWGPRPIESITEESVEIVHCVFQSAFELIDRIKAQHGQAVIIKIHLYGSAWNGKSDEYSNLNYWVQALAYSDGELYYLPEQNIRIINDEMHGEIIMSLGRAIDAGVPVPERNTRPHQNFHVFPENQPEIPNLLREQFGSDKFVTPEGLPPYLPHPAPVDIAPSRESALNGAV